MIRRVHHWSAAACTVVIALVAVSIWMVDRAQPDRTAGLRAGAEPAALLSDRDQAVEALADLPLTFVENRGQIDPQVRYHGQGPRHAFHLTPQEVVMSFPKADGSKGLALALRFIGANPSSSVEGVERSPGYHELSAGQ
jgi:hypothetical protein